ncbi:mechanosensitive ion channel family protein [Candidatus Omnitrophota bacterium]
METLTKITGYVFLENRVLDYIITAALFLLGVLVVKIILRFLVKRLKKWAKKTKTTVDDFLINTIDKKILPSLYFGTFFLSIKTLTLSAYLNKVVDILGIAVLTVVVVRVALDLIHYVLRMYWLKRGKDMALERSLKGMLSVIRIIVWALAVVFFLDNLGFKISAVIAGLGVGGIAIALAAQAVLGDLFSYFSILFDRPFEIGDFIIMDDYLGAVEYIGIKTTRIRSLGGEQLIFSNTDLTNSRVRNYKRMEQRRVLFKLGVTYQTSLDTVKKIPKMIEDTVKAVDDTVFDRAHFFSYGDFSLVFEVVYYVMGPDYNKYMDTQQKINFSIKEKFEKEGIEFAYPTQTLYVSKTGA